MGLLGAISNELDVIDLIFAIPLLLFLFTGSWNLANTDAWAECRRLGLTASARLLLRGHGPKGEISVSLGSLNTSVM